MAFDSGSPFIAIDTETTGLDRYKGDRPFLVTMTDYCGESIALRASVDPFTRQVEWYADARTFIVSILENPAVTKIMHNAKFDVGMLESMFDIKIKGCVLDTIIFAHVADSSREMGLKPLCKDMFGIDDDDQKDLKEAIRKARLSGKKLGWKLAEEVEADYWLPGCEELCEKYGKTDTERTMALFWFYEDMYAKDEAYRNLVDMEHKVLWVTKEMEDDGVGIDIPKCHELGSYYQSLMAQHRTKADELGYKDLNFNSPKQLMKVFYEDLGLPEHYKMRKDTKTGKRKKTLCIDSSVLEGFAEQGIELARAIVGHKEAHHQLTSFVDVFIAESVHNEEGFPTIHPNYKTCGPITGRLSCTKPNLMNISNPDETKSGTEVRIRECFVPRGKDMVLYFTDYAQVEVWLAMFLSQDLTGMTALLSGADMHGNMARKIWGGKYDFSDEKLFKKWRKRAKFILFGLIYGAGIGPIKDIIGCSDEEANRIKSIFWDTYPTLYRYSQKLAEQAERLGYVTNKFGRKYHLNGDTPYKALNYMIQGTAAEVMKRALIDIRNKLKLRPQGKYPRAKLLLTIHDETCVEAHKDDSRVPKIIAEAMSGRFNEIIGIPVRMKCEISVSRANWGEKVVLDPQPVLED